jgi:hypothetical protein
MYRNPESIIAVGNVRTHAIAMFRIVDSWRPDPLAAIVPATPDDRTWVVDTGETVHVSSSDRAGRYKLGSRALTIGQMRLANLFADRDDDALPPDHRAEPEGNSDRDLDPSGDELRRGIERLLVGVQRRHFFFRQVVVLVLHQVTQCFVNKIHVVASIADRFAGNLRQRAVFLDLLVDVPDQHREGWIGAPADLMMRNIGHHGGARITEDVVASSLFFDDL